MKRLKYSCQNFLIGFVLLLCCLGYQACEYTGTLETRISKLEEEAKKATIVHADTFLDKDGDTVVIQKRVIRLKKR